MSLKSCPCGRDRFIQDKSEASVEGSEYESVLTTSDVEIPIQVPLDPGAVINIDDMREMRYYGEQGDHLFFYPTKHEDEDWRKKFYNHRQLGLDSVLPIWDDDFGSKYYPNLDKYYVGSFNFTLNEADHIEVSG